MAPIVEHSFRVQVPLRILPMSGIEGPVPLGHLLRGRGGGHEPGQLEEAEGVARARARTTKLRGCGERVD